MVSFLLISQNHSASPHAVRDSKQPPILRKSLSMSALPQKEDEEYSFTELQESNARTLFITPKVQAKINALLISKAFSIYTESHPTPSRIAGRRDFSAFEKIIDDKQNPDETILKYFDRLSFAKAAIDYLTTAGKPENIKKINRLYNQFKETHLTDKQKKDILDDMSAYIQDTKKIGNAESLRQGWGA